MKKSLAMAAGAAFLIAAGLPLAQDMKAQMSKPNATASQSGPSMSMGQMDEHIQMMKTLHEKMSSATTPEAKQILMDKQREEMQGCMAMMTEMHKGDGKMGGMGGGMMAQKDMPAGATAQMQMMQKRMDMMEMMMQTMLDQQGMIAGAKSSIAAPRM